jgi:hypothetical protein
MRDKGEFFAGEAAWVVVFWQVRGVVELVASEMQCMWVVCVISDAATSSSARFWRVSGGADGECRWQTARGPANLSKQRGMHLELKQRGSCSQQCRQASCLEIVSPHIPVLPDQPHSLAAHLLAHHQFPRYAENTRP